jgi:hypothetical protein
VKLFEDVGLSPSYNIQRTATIGFSRRGAAFSGNWLGSAQMRRKTKKNRNGKLCERNE